MAWNEPGPNRDPWNQGPGGGKRGGDGPPDLDELLRRLKARLGGKGPRPPSGGGGAGLPAGLLGVAIAVIAALWLFTGFYVVDEQERGVVMRFGAYSRTTVPGWGWHAPWPVEKVEVVNVTQVRQVNDRATMLTKDENIVDVELTVQYRVSSAEQYLFSVDDPDMTLRQATKSAVRETVGRSEMDFILTEGREAIADRTKQLLQDRLDAYKCLKLCSRHLPMRSRHVKTSSASRTKPKPTPTIACRALAARQRASLKRRKPIVIR